MLNNNLRVNLSTVSSLLMPVSNSQSRDLFTLPLGRVIIICQFKEDICSWYLLRILHIYSVLRHHAKIFTCTITHLFIKITWVKKKITWVDVDIIYTPILQMRKIRTIKVIFSRSYIE